jgi:hypothetical protein
MNLSIEQAREIYGQAVQAVQQHPRTPEALKEPSSSYSSDMILSLFNEAHLEFEYPETEPRFFENELLNDHQIPRAVSMAVLTSFLDGSEDYEKISYEALKEMIVLIVNASPSLENPLVMRSYDFEHFLDMRALIFQDLVGHISTTQRSTDGQADVVLNLLNAMHHAFSQFPKRGLKMEESREPYNPKEIEIMEAFMIGSLFDQKTGLSPDVAERVASKLIECEIYPRVLAFMLFQLSDEQQQRVLQPLLEMGDERAANFLQELRREAQYRGKGFFKEDRIQAVTAYLDGVKFPTRAPQDVVEKGDDHCQRAA